MEAAAREALLIKAHKHIVELEAEVSRLKQESTINRVKEDFYTKDRCTRPTTDVERQQKLEQERCQLVEELAVVKERLSQAEDLQKETNKKYELLLERYHSDTQTFKAQEENLMLQMTELDALNDEMQGELNEVNLIIPGHKLDQIEELEHEFSKSVGILKARINELESVESKLLLSEAEVKQLQHQLRISRQDNLFIENMKETILSHESLQLQVHKLTEENSSLRQDRANIDLLRYQVQNLQCQCEEAEGWVEELERLRTENHELRTRGSNTHDGALSTLQIRLAELQQREIVSLKKYGELGSQLKVCQQDLKRCQDLLREAQKKLALEKDKATAANGRILKLERRLIFVTKERDGCVNVLNSYNLDTGVDGLMRELLAEKEREIRRSKEMISELESRLEDTVRVQLH